MNQTHFKNYTFSVEITLYGYFYQNIRVDVYAENEKEAIEKAMIRGKELAHKHQHYGVGKIKMTNEPF